MPSFEDELANALGAFKMQLDTRDQLAPRTRESAGVTMRQSQFQSQLPSIPPIGQQSGQAPSVSSTPPQPGHILIINGSTDSGVLTEANGVFQLQKITFSGGLTTWSYGPNGKGPSPGQQYVWSLTFTPGAPHPWFLLVGVLPTGSEFQAFGDSPGVAYPNIQPNGTGTGTFY